MSPSDDRRTADTAVPSGQLAARLARLGDAMDAFLRFQASGERADRAQFLAQHDDLRDLLEPMLDDAATDLFDEVELEPTRAEDLVIGPDLCVGDYRIVREVGRGGMGTVYEARQISLDRRVALKLLHSHLAFAPRSIERFRQEAAAAARLTHPGIVPIIEVGEWRGRHFFSMEFVDGRPLHEVMLHERLGVRSDCSRAAECAELVARVADALQHAHDGGLVHRDVKPHNVMIGADGQVRLLDFGLAKNLASEAHSVSGEFLGTPHYCSPEQINGQTKVGPRSDVFSLGIVLYELLARQRPFDGESARVVMQRIEAGQFEALRRVAPTTPRDLQTICHKALELQPSDRYASAGEFAADLRRFLRIEPIHAAPPNAIVCSIKWVRRHRLRVALWTTATLLVVGAPTAYALHEHNTALLVQHERAMLDQAEDVAFRGIEQTLSLLGEQLDRQPGPGSRHEPRIEAVVRLCENFLDLRAAEPTRRIRVAQAFYVTSGIYLQLDDAATALAVCDRARVILGVQADRSETGPGAELEGRLLRRELHIRQRLQPHESDEQFERAIAHWRRLVEPSDARLELVVEYAETLLVRARALADQSKRRLEAERLLRRVLAVLPPERRQSHVRAQVTALRANTALGYVLLWTGRSSQALTVLTETVASIEALPADPVLAVEQTLATAGIGDAQQRLGKHTEAESALRTAIASATKFVAEFPGSLPLRRALLRSQVRLGTQLLSQRKVDDAEQILRQAATGFGDEVVGRGTNGSWMDRELRADLDLQLANCILIRCNGTGDCSEAESLLHAACALLEALSQEQPEQFEFQIELGASLNNLAALANQRTESRTAIDFAQRAIAQQEIALAIAPENRRARMFLGMHFGQLALGLANSGDFDGAVQAAKAAAEHAPRHTATLRMAAEVATRAAAATAADLSLDPALRTRSVEERARLAVAALEQIAKTSKAEARRWLGEPRFEFLSERADFKHLAREVADR